METKERKELWKHKSINRHTGEVTTLRLLSGPGGRTYQGEYADEIKKKDRLIYVELSKDDVVLEYPPAIIDQEKLWEFIFDVWVKPDKIRSYCKRFINLINKKLIQRKFDGFGKAYWEEDSNKEEH